MACIIYELIAGDYLFKPDHIGDEVQKQMLHLAQITELIGPCKSKKFFDDCQVYDSYFNK